MDIIQAYATKNLCYIAAQKMIPKGIVVHSTGSNNPTLKRYVDSPDEVGVNRFNNHWNTAKPGGKKKCVHAFIGYDKNNEIRVAEILPLDICCWGVGKGKKEVTIMIRRIYSLKSVRMDLKIRYIIKRSLMLL